jgi:amidophosphoribosyltransferase
MCGEVGVYGHERAAEIAFQINWLHQNRGQDSFGVKVWNKDRVEGPGNREEQPTEKYYRKQIKGLEGRIAIAHVRYATSGTQSIKNSQPLSYNDMAIAHNGNLTNAESIRKDLESQGRTFISEGSDTEVILQLIKSSEESTIENKVIDALKKVEGAYSFVFMAENKLIAVKDKWGYRPLSMGKFGDAYVVASERQALARNSVTNIKELNPGEMVVIDKTGVNSYDFGKASKLQQCVFELVYFANPCGAIFGMKMDGAEFRYQNGIRLAREHPVEADVVIPVSDSGNHAAQGYAKESGIEYREGLLRSHSAGKTFTLCNQELRAKAVQQKHTAIKSVVNGNRIVVVDDSLVRGTTAKKIGRMLKNAGASEIHMRIASPPVKFPCHYGIATPTKEELIAANMVKKEISEEIEVDSLEYLSKDGMLNPLENADDFCKACFDGSYAENLGDLVQIGQLRS